MINAMSNEHGTFYCSRNVSHDINLQAYLGRSIKIEEAKKKVIQYKKSNNGSADHIIEIPLEQFLLDKQESESYKQLNSLQILKGNNDMYGYTSICTCFMIFVNEKLVKINKS